MNELPQMLHTWFTENDERLRSHGVMGDIQRSPDDGRTKTSAWLVVEYDDHVAVLIVWNSGEAELECGDLTSGRVRQEHRDLRTPGDLLDAIETTLEWAGATSL
ncbi:hypothetical protein G3I19_22665 [Streptomyces sp. SID10853]|uniref:hypothetical protein n=1 Tax=Streptomyces sp. SID10853 TaxID=2706028 RepID=UPI0013C18F3E|nr:hypothetical protein [Streptomyces sp. SID10853]NDZ81282.1 hypothetical protein [Streptomyces sp. SID10853]